MSELEERANNRHSELYGRPTAEELVEAVREFLEKDVMSATEGRVQFHTRVAINALNTVQRELELGAAQRRPVTGATCLRVIESG